MTASSSAAHLPLPAAGTHELSCHRNPLVVSVSHDLSQPFFLTAGVILLFSSPSAAVRAVALRTSCHFSTFTLTGCASEGGLSHNYLLHTRTHRWRGRGPVLLQGCFSSAFLDGFLFLFRPQLLAAALSDGRLQPPAATARHRQVGPLRRPARRRNAAAVHTSPRVSVGVPGGGRLLAAPFTVTVASASWSGAAGRRHRARCLSKGFTGVSGSHGTATPNRPVCSPAVLQRQTHLQCLHGSWDRTVSCQPTDCGLPDPSYVYHAEFSCPGGTTFGKQCSFTCRPPAVLQGQWS